MIGCEGCLRTTFYMRSAAQFPNMNLVEPKQETPDFGRSNPSEIPVTKKFRSTAGLK